MSAVILTENIILSRTRAHDLKDVRKLNCWNFELTDVTIVRSMPYVQVLSFSMNKITTLADFAHCPQLEELYLRKNHISDINEVFYLKHLPKLRKLWLAENPCAETSNYRATVLKALPNLTVFDNIIVTDDEVRCASESGNELFDPEDAQQSDQVETASVAESDDQVFIENYTDSEFLSDMEPMNKIQNSSKHAYLNQNDADCHNTIVAVGTGNDSSAISGKQSNARLSYSQSEGEWCTNGKETPKSAVNIRHSAVSSSTPRHTSQSQTPVLRSSSINEHNVNYSNNGHNRHSISNCNYDLYSGAQTDNLSSNGQSALKFAKKQNFSSNTSLNSNNTSSGVQQQKVLLSKGGKNRNSNLLSAVLCLIKELDFASLEVVETAVHCRMEELEE